MTITIEKIKVHVGSTFQARTQGGHVPLLLIEATERPRKGLPEEFRAPISLVFHGPLTMLLVQASYSLDHPALGLNDWMLTPISKYATLEFANAALKNGAPRSDQRALYEVILA